MNHMNRLYNVKNPNQGSAKKVLCVCSAGLLRSPTAAEVLSQKPFRFNTRAVGLDVSHALIPLDEVHIEWADVILCMDYNQWHSVCKMTSKEVCCLDIPDNYGFRDPKLITLIKDRAKEIFK